MLPCIWRSESILVLLEPARCGSSRTIRRCSTPWLQQGRDHLYSVRTGHDRLDGVGAGMDAAAGGQRQAEVLAESTANQVHAQRQIRRARTAASSLAHFERLDVDVRLVEAIEQHQAVDARLRPGCDARLARTS